MYLLFGSCENELLADEKIKSQSFSFRVGCESEERSASNQTGFEFFHGSCVGQAIS